MRYLKLSDVCARFDVEDELVTLLVKEGVIQIKHSLEDEALISAEDAERLRVGVLLLREMDVNLAGVEVALHLRDEMLAMQQQFDDILHELVTELRERMKR